ncbi:hypothetical protein BFP70_13980 [Thioclava sp. SK-1]|uniref:hypothetical protein n=1 Tax=Thioclava sp. SK-1 TaxID=1889770 RepID=UPI00082572A2|nr:hypothetical protein [Thioclava sp. SK-1]OCX62283.1 hypothetical protein BFP70_13980 [Thioclava sp. SK-1]
MRQKIDIYSDYLDQVWRQGDITAIDRFWVQEAVSVGLIADFEMTRADISELVPAVHAHLDAIHYDILYHSQVDDVLHVVVQVNGMGHENRTKVSFTGQSTLVFTGDKFSRSYDHYDLISFFAQLGLLPPDTVALCLSGESLS